MVVTPETPLVNGIGGVGTVLVGAHLADALQQGATLADHIRNCVQQIMVLDLVGPLAARLGLHLAESCDSILVVKPQGKRELVIPS